MKFTLSILFALALIAPFSAFGQDYTSSNKKAIKAYEKAMAAYEGRANAEAEEQLLDALEKDPQFIEAHILLSDVYIEAGMNNRAIDHLRTAIELDPNFYPNNFFFLAELEFADAQYQEALQHFNALLGFAERPKEMVERSELGAASCEFAINAVKNPVPFYPANLGPAINSDLPEYFPGLTADNQTLLYTRRLNDERSYSGFNEDFFMSTKTGETWNASRNIGPPVNSANNEGAPTIAPDGQTVIFTACATIDGYGQGRVGLGSCDLFVTRKLGTKWTPPANLGEGVNTRNWETQPSLSADGRTLYFIRGRVTREGIKQQDIFVTRLGNDGEWSRPEPLGPTINTAGREVSVHIHPDGQTLYFASDGHPGMGGLDLFVSRKQPNGQWGPAINLGYPINTNKDESSLLVSADGNVGYFASDREGGLGDLDLYKFPIPQQHQPARVTYLKGRVFEKGTKKPLGAHFELIDVANETTIIESFADPVSGHFLVCLPANREYALNVSKKGYLFHSEHFSLKQEADARKPYQKDVPLSQPKVDETVILENVFFDTDKFDLKAESRAELNKLVQYLSNNPSLKGELGGHTDNVGSDDQNQVLSENRAKAVYNYLVENGVEAGRLSYKGYGESSPIESNDTEAGRARNRRTEFRITGIN